MYSTYQRSDVGSCSNKGNRGTNAHLLIKGCEIVVHLDLESVYIIVLEGEVKRTSKEQLAASACAVTIVLLAAMYRNG